MLQIVLLMAFLGVHQTPSTTAQVELTGKVIDRAGSALPGVTVTLEGATPDAARKTVTGTAGEFRLDNVPAGTYTVRFELTGFTPYSRTRLALGARPAHNMTVALEVGRMTIVDKATAIPPPPEPKFELKDGETAVGVETSLGTFYIAVDTKRAPVTAANFLRYVDGKFYDEGRFHRATRADNYTPAPPNRPMMNIIQGGINPARSKEGFAQIPLERTNLTGITHVTGVVSMARGTADSATSDFFVLLDDQPSLDYGGLRFEDGQGGAAFGRVVAGLDVVKKIQQQPVDGQNLSGPVTIRRVWRLNAR
jgi:peptidyl-prolyl cis-trans isomerase A (cyclophilin A)